MMSGEQFATILLIYKLLMCTVVCLVILGRLIIITRPGGGKETDRFGSMRLNATGRNFGSRIALTMDGETQTASIMKTLVFYVILNASRALILKNFAKLKSLTMPSSTFVFNRFVGTEANLFMS